LHSKRFIDHHKTSTGGSTDRQFNDGFSFGNEIVEWSRRNGWAAHRPTGPQIKDVLVDGNWFAEYLYRSKVDMLALQLIENIQQRTSEGREDLKRLLSLGEDVIDIIQKDADRNKCFLVDIHRYMAYEEWKFLHDSGVKTVIEDGALAIAKFFSGKDLLDMISAILSSLAFTLEIRVGVRFGFANDAADECPYPIREILIETSNFFAMMSFEGNVDDYYDPNNSLIDAVLICKRGIPMTLAIIYIVMVRRAFGIELDMIGLPGHIVVGVPESMSDERIFVDPFDAGRIMTFDDCRQIVQRYSITFQDEMANPITHQDVWQRIVRNLIHALFMPAMEDRVTDDRLITPLTTLLKDKIHRIANTEQLFDSEEWLFESITNS
jgi:hypothetical protein